MEGGKERREGRRSEEEKEGRKVETKFGGCEESGLSYNVRRREVQSLTRAISLSLV